MTTILEGLPHIYDDKKIVKALKKVSLLNLDPKLHRHNHNKQRRIISYLIIR